MNHRTRFGLLIGGATLLAISNAATAANRNVPADYATIQAAIDAAVDGDSVLISPGTYFENIEFDGKQIVVRSVDRDPTTVTIDGGGLDTVVRMSGTYTNDAKLIGVTVTNGETVSIGGGVFIDDGSPLIRRCIIHGNTANLGGGIAVDDGSPEISQCLIYSNSSAASAGGIYINGATNPKIINSLIALNEAALEGGGIFTFAADTEVRNSIIRNNGDSNLYITSGTLLVEHSNVTGGWAGTGNIDAAPIFIDAGNNDFRLAAGSPCIDAGDSNALASNINEDIAKNPRRMHDPNTANTGIGVPIIDMGAYEYIPRVRYVNVDATGAGTGMTWDDAYTDFVDAIDAVSLDPGADEIWVADGTYKADRGTGDRSMSFAMQNNQTWHGGFAGGELFVDEADWLANPTVLGGDIGVGGVTDNTISVVTADGVNSTSRIDGFIIQKGYADIADVGAGIFVSNFASPTIRNCWVRLNEVPNATGGILCLDSDPSILRCRVNLNDGKWGGGVHIVGGDPTLYSCLIGGNTSSNAAPGVLVQDGAVTILNCTVYEHHATGIAAGGVFIAAPSTITMANSIIWGNSGDGSTYFGNVTIIDFSGALLANNTIEGDSGFDGLDPNFGDYDGANNIPGDGDDDLRLSANSRAIDSGDNSFINAYAYDYYGNDRRLDDTGMPDGGNGTSPIADRGFAEYTGTSCVYDCDANGNVGIGDLLYLLAAWGSVDDDPTCDYEPNGGDGFVDVLELLGLLSAWGPCPE